MLNDSFSWIQGFGLFQIIFFIIEFLYGLYDSCALDLLLSALIFFDFRKTIKFVFAGTLSHGSFMNRLFFRLIK